MRIIEELMNRRWILKSQDPQLYYEIKDNAKELKKKLQEKFGYALIINNFDIFMSGDLRKKEIIIESFEKNVLPWWQSQVEQYQVGGKAKPFNVYVVD